MIACAQCGKKNKNDATVCKYCGYNPGALRANSTPTWSYQSTSYSPMPYQPPMQQGGQYYYDANGKAYSVKYDYKVTPVEDDEEDAEEEEVGAQRQMLLYPYNPALVQQQQAVEKKEPEQKNAMAWVGYILAMFFDILAWPFCLIGLAIAHKRNGAKKKLCEGGMMFTLLRLVTVLFLFLVWWGVSSFWPEFFVEITTLKVALVKIVLFGWPVVVGSIFMKCSAEDSGLEAAGQGYFYFSIAVALIGVIFLDVSILPIFS